MQIFSVLCYKNRHMRNQPNISRGYAGLMDVIFQKKNFVSPMLRSGSLY